ncbi:hypothetical protein D7X32_08935 [Corallococcus carmarthensis]|uniref:Tyr recombinase domain-containing protein n=1 Tax=Corallococcus carmarthensis TaxID=2316728 RepID=A0A3A8KLE4_9BACT|nr:hypothetical protein D7X32_08935 [Corallococcus carmarthensis]
MAAAIRMRLDALPPEFASKRNLEQKLRYVATALGTRLVDSVTPADVLQVLAKLTKLSPQSREHVRMAGQGLYSFLDEKAGLFSGPNPFKKAGKVRVPKREVGFYTPEQVAQLFAALSPEHRPAVATSVLTGLRKGEVRVLRKDEVHLVERYLLVRRSGHRDTTKGGRERRVPIPEVLVPTLEEQLATPGPHLFPRPGTTKPFGPSWRIHDIIRRALVRARLVQAWTHVCRRKGCGFREERQNDAPSRCPRCNFQLWPKGTPLTLRFKHLRSTWGTVAYQTTKDIRLVAEVLGHADVETTRAHYAVALPEHVRAGSDAVAATLDPWRPRGVKTEEAQVLPRKVEDLHGGRNVNKNEGLARQRKAGEGRSIPTGQFPKPQATGSIPVGVTRPASQPHGKQGVLLSGDVQARSLDRVPGGLPSFLYVIPHRARDAGRGPRRIAPCRWTLPWVENCIFMVKQ